MIWFYPLHGLLYLKSLFASEFDLYILNRHGTLFLSHIAEDINDSPTFSNGVLKEGLQIDEVLVRISVLSLIREKVKFASENPGTPLFSDDIMSQYAGLRSTNRGKEENDLVLLHAVLNFKRFLYFCL
ncbi:CHD3-type chromatin-remodeling factor PICKLE-like [Medicago truncatula]|uniref:CHD3-type chromatin-remodeling factor PICKLE-like n=1 Tax=Medicago truncatula TaxID=3880 RepID=UPI00196721F3|nr:CHD3-type chromatin-remodeling factor PICKLE-like [Medicago truncatula]